MILFFKVICTELIPYFVQKLLLFIKIHSVTVKGASSVIESCIAISSYET